MSEVPPWGVILAGGLARRMGGGDKPLRSLGGRPILDRVLERLEPQCAGVLLNANGDPDRFASYRLPVAADSVPGQAGPLAGILAGLDWLAVNRADAKWMVSVAGDLPFLPPDLTERLQNAQRAAEAEIVCAASGGRTHWVTALWDVTLRDDLRRFLMGEQGRRTADFVARHRATSAAWPTAPLDPFFNANTPDDLREAERLARLVDRLSS